MRYFGIKDPGGTIRHISRTRSKAWRRFFTNNTYRLPLELAIKAYTSIGYKCIELEVREVKP